MNNRGKPAHLNVQRKDLSQFVENVTTQQEESKIYDSINNESKYGGKSDNWHSAQIHAENQNWYELRLPGKCPERRAYHTAFNYGKKMFIFGGHDIKEGSNDTLWMLDLSRLNEQEKNENADYSQKTEWVKLETIGKDRPGPIAHHTSVVYREKMYLFGGTTLHPLPSTLYFLELKSLRWEVQHARGELPKSRDDHTAVLYEDSMVIFGGFVDGERTNTIYRYYFNDNKWEKVAVLGIEQPSPRAGHSAIVYNDTMVVFGGRDEDNNKLNDLWMFNFTNYQWELIESLQPPLPRSGHTACLYKDMMIIFGGIYEVTRELDDMHLFDFRNKRWIEFFEEASSPVKIKQSLSPEGSPTSKFSAARKQESFKIDFSRPGTQGQSLGSPHRKGAFQNQSRFSIRKTDQSQVIQNQLNQSKSNIRSPNNKSRSQTAGTAKRKRTLGRPGGTSLFHHDKEKDQAPVQLESPTSVSMKNSFIIKNADPSFEAYYNSMRKRRTNATQSFFGTNSTMNNAEGSLCKVAGRRPAARDGQSGLVYLDNFLVFGGDRHHMPFNDLFCLDLRKEFIMRSHIFH